VQRDVKVPPSKPPVSLNVMNPGQDTAASSDVDATKAVGSTTTVTESDENEKPRPHTVYDADEVYGGM